MHTDPDVLILLALGERGATDAERAHLDRCPACARDLSELEELSHLGRRLSPETTMATPSRDVWTRIRSELDLDPSLEPPTHAPLFLASDPLLPPPDPAPRRGLLSKVRSLITGEPVQAYAARLFPTDAEWADADGRAELGTDAHGRRVLTVSMEAQLPTYGLRQAWLVHRSDPTVRQAVGILDGTNGLWTIDRAVDVTDFATIEVSQQAVGSNEFSGETILRGELVASSH